MNAVILAAGEATRLQPLTQTRPKGMLPVGDKPLLEHIIDAIEAAGIDEIVFVVGHKRERIQSYFQNGDDWNVDIQYVVQERPRGTGDALLEAEHAVGGDCVVTNGDRIVEPELLSRVIERYRSTGNACLGVTEVTDPTQYGAVTLDGDTVTEIREKPDTGDSGSKFLAMGPPHRKQHDVGAKRIVDRPLRSRQ